MAKKTTCDICDEPAQAEAEFKTSTTSPLKWDLCQPHLAELKKIIRVFSKQEVGELEVTDEEVKVSSREVIKEMFEQALEENVKPNKP